MLNKSIILLLLFILFPIIVNAANIQLPYYNSFENYVADKIMDDGDCGGLDSYPRGSCQIYVRDDYEARHGSKYLTIECNYSGNCDDRNDMLRADVVLEGFQKGLSCHIMSTNDDTEYWIGWSNYIPADYTAEYFNHAMVQIIAPSVSYRQLIWNISYGGEKDDYYSAFSGLHKWSDSDNVSGNAWPIYNLSWAAFKGQWVDWVLHVVWHDTDDKDAIFRVYMNGVEVYGEARDGLKNMPTDARPQWYALQAYNTHYSSTNNPCSSHIKQYNIPHQRATFLDELRFDEGAIGKNDYCDVCPPIVADRPTLSYPEKGLVDIPTTFTAVYSGYKDKRSDEQSCFSYTKTQVQVDEKGGDWSSLVYDSGEATAETTSKVNGLYAKTQYQIRVRHKSERKGSPSTYWGGWSDTVIFSTGIHENGNEEIPTPHNLIILQK